MGLSDHGNNTVVGVDITEDHQYPFEFIHSDVFDLKHSFLRSFDLIWASPPCQSYLPMNNWRGNEYPDLIERTRMLLNHIGVPYVIENVPNAPIRRDLLLCGEMFEGLRVLRHRIFEFGNGFKAPYVLQHRQHKINRLKDWKRTKDSYYACLAGHGGNSYSFHLKDWQKAVGIDWITKKEHLTQAIPPKYSNYIITNKIKNLRRLEDYLE